MQIVYRYFLLFEDLPLGARLKKSSYNNSYFGHGLCQFLNYCTGSNFDYLQITTEEPIINAMNDLLWKEKY